MKYQYDNLFHCILIFLVAAMIGGCSGPHGNSEKVPTAVRGVLDLRDWNFRNNSLLNLDGEWEFYWNQLLTPADFRDAGARVSLPRSPARFTGIITIPGSWDGYRVNHQKLNGDGYATYSLKLLLPKNPPHLGLNIPQLYTAYQLWANGKLVASAGKVGRSRETMTPQYRQRVISCRPKNGRLELVIRVSNFYHQRGGIWRSIQLGPYARVKRDNDLGMAFGLLVLGSFILMAFYNLNLYFYFKKDRAPLLLAIFFGIGALRSFLVGQLFYTRVFPAFDWELAIKLEYFTFYFCGPVFYRMLRRLYPSDIPALFIRLISWAAYIFAAMTLLTPARFYTHFAPVFQVILLGSVVYMLAVLVRLSARRKEYLMLSVFFIIFLSLFNDVLFYHNIFRAEFPTIPLLEGWIHLPYLNRIPFGFVSMVFFVLIFNLLTLKMTQYYFTKYLPKMDPDAALSALADYRLSPRETELVGYLTQGLSNKEIAAKLAITEGTVKVHLHHIYEKTGTANRTELSHLLHK